MEPENPYQAPAATDIPDAFIQPGEFELAGRGERFAAALVDGLINMVFILVLVFGLIWGGSFQSFVDFANAGFLMTTLITVTSALFYIGINWKFLTTNGQTLGKKFANIRIVTLDGQLPSIFDLIFKRYGFYTVVALIPVVGSYLSIINILFIFGRERRCLHDHVAGTRVVKNLPKEPTPQQDPPTEMKGEQF
jgi:uncharacterized RDD family membrane protein YckC